MMVRLIIFLLNFLTFFANASDDLLMDVSGTRALIYDSIAHELKSFGIDTSFTYTMTEKATVNLAKDQNNPLYKQPLSHILDMGPWTTVVLNNDPSSIYMMDYNSTTSHSTILSAEKINDAQGNITSGIDSLAYISTVTDATATNYTLYICTTVKGNESVGDSAGGVALIKVDFEDVEKQPESTTKSKKEKKSKNNVQEDPDINKNKEAKPKQAILNILNAQDGRKNGNRAVLLNKTASCVQINNGLDSINNISMIWYAQTNRLYVGLNLHTKENAENNQGGYALLVGRIERDCLILEPIAEAIPSQGNNIIGAVGPDKYVSMHKLQAMTTSTGLPYLIVHGGNGKPEETRRKIYALPLTDKRDRNNQNLDLVKDQEHGKLAHCHAKTTNRIWRSMYRPLGVTLCEPAKTVEDLFTDQDQQICVGGTSEAPGTIDFVTVRGDSVFIIVNSPDDGQKGGIFYSQAIFDAQGRITMWTNWRRSLVSDEKLLAMEFDVHGKLLVLQKDQKNQLSYVKSQWKLHSDRKKDDTFLSILAASVADFPAETGGVQGLYSFNYDTPGLFDKERYCLLVMTGYQKVVLLHYNINDGITKKIIIADDVLKTLGPITSAELISDESDTWLVVGGVLGGAVLCTAEGHGWNSRNDISQLSQVIESMSFKSIGSFRFIKKMQFDNTAFYILTRDTLEKIESHNFKKITSDLHKIIIARVDQNGSFADVAVSHGTILLATSQHLLVGNALEFPLHWQPIEMPLADNYIKGVSLVTQTGKVSDFSSGAQGYILLNSRSQSTSTVYRFFIKFDQLEWVNEGQSKKLSCYAQYNPPHRKLFSTNGSQFICCSDKGFFKPLIELSKVLKSGLFDQGNNDLKEICPIENGSTMTALIQDWATGNWIVGGNFGLYIHGI